jgi:hypothetical protein
VRRYLSKWFSLRIDSIERVLTGVKLPQCEGEVRQAVVCAKFRKE